MAEGEWTVAALKEYVDQRLADLHELFMQGLHDLEQRLSEFHQAYDTHHDDVVEEVGRVREDVAKVREEISATAGSDRNAQRFISWGIAGVAALAGFGVFVYYLVHH